MVRRAISQQARRGRGRELRRRGRRGRRSRRRTRTSPPTTRTEPRFPARPMRRARSFPKIPPARRRPVASRSNSSGTIQELSTFIVAADKRDGGARLHRTRVPARQPHRADRLPSARATGIRGARGRAAAASPAYLHDVGNMISREMHGQTGALLVYEALRDEAARQDLDARSSPRSRTTRSPRAPHLRGVGRRDPRGQVRRAPQPRAQVRPDRSSTSTTA